MLDTVGPELQVCNTSGSPIELNADNHVIITPDISKVPSAEVLPINYTDLAKVSMVTFILEHAAVMAYLCLW